MRAAPTVADVIVKTASNLASLGIDIDSVNLGLSELDELAKVIDPHYSNTINIAKQSGMVFYWQGYRIVPHNIKHEFYLSAKKFP